MDRYFYSIEQDGSGQKNIHISGNLYFNDACEMENNHRLAEWTGLYIPVSVAKDMIENGMFFDYINEKVAYEGDFTEADAIKMSETYFVDTGGKQLHIKDILPGTMCGDYYMECGVV